MNKSNAALIAANRIFGVNHLVALTIFVEGEEITHYKHFELSQSAVKHHTFDLVLDHDVLATPQNHDMEEAREMLGKSIMVTFRYKNLADGMGPERNFIGVITQVGFTRKYGNKGNIVLKGSSPTILLDGAPHTQSFGGEQVISLHSIAKEMILEGLGSDYKFKHRIDPGYTNNISYSCQYHETHYNYLARLAASYGEQFFYDGRILHFGKLPTAEEAVTLTFGKDVEEIDIKMCTRHVSREVYGYNSSLHEPFSINQTNIAHQSSLAKSAYRSSEQTFKTPSLSIAPMKAGSYQDVEASHNGTLGNEMVNVFVTTGKTSVPFLYPGCVVQMYMRQPQSAETDYLTKLMITDIKHSVDALGNYTGYFEAIAEGTGYLPAPQYHTPIAEPQMALVKRNNDEQGRVQVIFDWQLKGYTTDWIRVLTPDAGSSDKVSKNRGFVFIPEVDDQVMIGFVHSHPDRPYVMGGLFHGEIGAGGYANNHLKTIKTRSGCTIQIDDDENEGSITITDPSGNTWYMDGAGNIEVTAPENININAGKDINMVAGENMNVSVGKNMNTNIGNDNTVMITKSHLFTSDSYDQNVKKNKSITIGGDLDETTSKTTHKATKGDVLIQSAGVAKILGKIDAKVNKG
ncbi:MAG TPA: phage baseplate assembly protein V [Mariniphaga sp.]|nr:phage baseplate assembly protein V [Mariniphaga sp.]